LTKAADRKFGGYSKGMKRKLTIAAGIIQKPEILFLDEPTTGIDVASARQIRQLIADLHRDGTTIFLTTHYIEEAERLCDRIGIIDHGEIIAEGSLDELRISNNADESIVFTFSNLSDIKINQVKEKLNNIIGNDENSITFSTKNSNRDMQLIISGLSETGLEISNIEIQKANLETIFLNLT
jgi:ABC-2 type transport system ATP-binding protein